MIIISSINKEKIVSYQIVHFIAVISNKKLLKKFLRNSKFVIFHTLRQTSIIVVPY